MEELFEPDTYLDVHMNLIRLGREICHARKPACQNCFLTEACVYYANLPDAEKVSAE